MYSNVKRIGLLCLCARAIASLRAASVSKVTLQIASSEFCCPTDFKLLREFSDSTCFVPKALDQLTDEAADANAIVTTTSLGLQQKGREALPNPLFVSAKYHCLQGNL
jgi:hypothetical protein